MKLLHVYVMALTAIVLITSLVALRIQGQQDIIVELERQIQQLKARCP